jgi:aspartyl-tRNA(Asn)/glutamyl-tRNA(Gln) amidotransferase subunit C
VSTEFTVRDVERIARLARLALTADEKTLFTRQLADMLAYVEQLREVDTSGVVATSHAVTASSTLREDEVRPSLARDEALAAAPAADRSAGLFKVPRVLGS